MELYLNTELTTEERAQDLLSKLSLDEKMAQVNCLFTYDGDWEWQKEYTRYGIGQVSALEVREMKSLREAAAWQNRLQKQIIENSPHHIPAIFHMEGCVRGIYSGIRQFPIWNCQGVYLGSGIGRTGRADGGKAGTILRYYPGVGSGSGYIEGFQIRTAGRNIWGGSDTGGFNGNRLYKGRAGREDQREKSRMHGETFSGISSFSGRDPWSTL